MAGHGEVGINLARDTRNVPDSLFIQLSKSSKRFICPFTKRDWERPKLWGQPKQKTFIVLFKLSSRLNFPSLLLDIDLRFAWCLRKKRKTPVKPVRLQLKSCILSFCCQKRLPILCDLISPLTIKEWEMSILQVDGENSL